LNTDNRISIKDHEEEIVEACAQDLHKPRFEAEVAESGWLLNDIVFTTRNLHKWVKDEKAPDIDLSFKFMSPKIRKDPLGTVLVIGYVGEIHLEITLRACSHQTDERHYNSVPSTSPSS
jgi:hypothetical protein